VSEAWTGGCSRRPVRINAMRAKWDVSTDEGLQAFIESLPTEAELRAELGDLLPQRRCAVCQILLPIGVRKDTRTSSQNCRQHAYEQRLKAAGRPYPRARSRMGQHSSQPL
jgi:hypothetical protein